MVTDEQRESNLKVWGVVVENLDMTRYARTVFYDPSHPMNAFMKEWGYGNPTDGTYAVSLRQLIIDLEEMAYGPIVNKFFTIAFEKAYYITGKIY